MSTKVRDPGTYHDGHQDGYEPLASVDLNQINSFSELLSAYQSSAFGARRLGEALEVMEAMAKDPGCFVVCTLSGAMTVAKMGLVVCEMIERGYIDAIVSTGALQAHGMIEGSGMSHFKYREGMDDTELYEKGYDRVYDTLELEKNLDDLQEIVSVALAGLDHGAVHSSHTIMAGLGAYLSEHFKGQRGILKSAYERGLPIYVPAFTDSELGLDVAVHNMARGRAGQPKLRFDPFEDLYHYADTIAAQERIGIFTIGGGVPRNWAQQVGPFLEISQLRLGDRGGVTKRFQYGVRICPEPVSWGGLSGCTYSEGMSWGKFVPEAEGGCYAEVLSDATMVWPLLIRALIERVPKKAAR